MTIEQLEPRILWGHFARICRVPHGSGNESALRDSLASLARSRGWDTATDAPGNLLIRVPATPGLEAAPPLVLQGHLDMVCEKNADSPHDFLRDGIQPWVDGGFVRGRGTTLGADNGIGLAAALALADDPGAVHGPLEILCTVEEETGLTGARGLDGSMLRGRTLLNLDSEDEGELYVGCSGGGDVVGTFAVPRVEPPQGEVLGIDVRGLLGGHSGLDINLGRGNSIAILSELLLEAIDAGLVVSVDTIAGGNLRNAIPREASAVVRVLPGHAEDLEVVALQKLGEAQEALGEADPGLRIDVGPAEGRGSTIPLAAIVPVLDMLLAMPRGVLAMSADIEGLVQTSNNLAVVKDLGEHLSVQACTRSSVAAELEEARARIGSGIEAIGGRVEMDESYPGWKPDLTSPVLARCIAVHERVFGHPPKVKAVHAGLECGILGKAVPGMDMVSMGPSIHHPHSPDEDVDIGSVGRFWTYLAAVAEDLAEGGR